MELQLHPVTEPGRQFVELAEKHAADFATRADQHDREGSFPFENWEAMRESGFLAACVPEDMGGLGLESLHDVTAGLNRLGRVDPSVGIGTNMHVITAWMLNRYVGLLGGGVGTEGLQSTLREIGSGEAIFCTAGTEPGSSPMHPMTTAVPVEGGYRISGRKIFGTNSPVATRFFTIVRVAAGDGSYLSGGATVPRDAAGLTVHDDWDALGMRASGSNSITFEDVLVPADAMNTFGPWGSRPTFHYEIATVGNIGLLGVFLGIAEAARDAAVDLALSRKRSKSGRRMAERGAVQHLIGEVEVDVHVMRAAVEHCARLLDATVGSRFPSHDEMVAAMRHFQATKAFVNQRAIEAVDRALRATGGAGFMASSPVARMYRDVRAGPFMQPWSPLEVYGYLGRLALGMEPDDEG
jgi:alkylation response protein AidB-like acyl-CoA dehydrogenase